MLSPASLLLLLLLASPPLPVQGQDLQWPWVEEFTDLCGNYTSSGPPIPTDIPRQFSLHVEANLLERNRSLLVHELFDDVNNRGSLYFVEDGVRQHTIFDYNKNEVFVLTDQLSSIGGDRECRAFPLTRARVLNFTFGLTMVNGSIHIGTPSSFLEHLRNSTPTQYFDLTSNSRGIPSLRWQACSTGENISFFSDYYFTPEFWDYEAIRSPEQFDTVLNQVVVRGNSIFNGTLRNFYHIYSFLGFNTGPRSVPDRAFQVPTGTPCMGAASGLPLPEIPQFFSTYIQFTDSSASPVQVKTFRVSFV